MDFKINGIEYELIKIETAKSNYSEKGYTSYKCKLYISDNDKFWKLTNLMRKKTTIVYKGDPMTCKLDAMVYKMDNKSRVVDLLMRRV